MGKNYSNIPEDVATYVTATKAEKLKQFEDLIKYALDFAKDPNLDLQKAKDWIAKHSGVVTAESKIYAEENKAVLQEYAISGGNQIQTMATSHAGRWVASAGSIIMVIAGVFRFSRR